MVPIVLVHSLAVDEPTVWCPSCGAEYRAGTPQCADCRVALVAERPEGRDDDLGDDDAGDGLVELGSWPQLQAQVLRRRLDTAGVPVMIEWSGPAGDRNGASVGSRRTGSRSRPQS